MFKSSVVPVFLISVRSYKLSLSRCTNGRLKNDVEVVLAMQLSHFQGLVSSLRCDSNSVSVRPEQLFLLL